MLHRLKKAQIFTVNHKATTPLRLSNSEISPNAPPTRRRDVYVCCPVSFSLWDVPEAYRQNMPPSAAKTKGSGLHCDCNARWLKDWLQEKKLGDMTCASPPSLTGVMVTQLQARHFVCGKFVEH